MALNEAAERLTETLRLARALPDAKVVFTGGSGALFGGEGIAGPVRQYFIDAGIAPDRIIVENNSRNTYENAVFTKAIVKPTPRRIAGSWLRRPIICRVQSACFAKSDSMSSRIPSISEREIWDDAFRPFDNIGAGLQRTDLAIKEWIGSARLLDVGQKLRAFSWPVTANARCFALCGARVRKRAVRAFSSEQTRRAHG